jgi:hypothetical protein
MLKHSPSGGGSWFSARASLTSAASILQSHTRYFPHEVNHHESMKCLFHYWGIRLVGMPTSSNEGHVVSVSLGLDLHESDNAKKDSILTY